MDKFSLNEIAEYIGDPLDTDERIYQGMDCEIIDPLGSSFNYLGNARYGVKFEDGVEMWVIPRCLRKKKPPRRKD